MIKILTEPNGQFNAVEVKAINGDDSLDVDMLVIDNSGSELYREVNYGLPYPWPFELTHEELILLRNM